MVPKFFFKWEEKIIDYSQDLKSERMKESIDLSPVRLVISPQMWKLNEGKKNLIWVLILTLVRLWSFLILLDRILWISKVEK